MNLLINIVAFESQVYRGADTKATLEDLEPGAEYEIRVMPIRCTSDGDLCGAFSSASSFSIPAVEVPAPVVRATTHQQVCSKSIVRLYLYRNFFLV